MTSEFVAALSGSAITAVASLGVVWCQSLLQSRSQRQQQLSTAVAHVLTLSMDLIHRAQGLRTLGLHHMQPLTGPRVLLRMERPLDLQGVLDEMSYLHHELGAAISQLWLAGENDLIVAVNNLQVAAAEVAAKLTVIDPKKPLAAQQDLDEEMTGAVFELGEQRRLLARMARKYLKNGPVEALDSKQQEAR